MFDKEFLRNQQLIEERMEYENEFISIPDIVKSNEWEYYANLNFEDSIEDINFEVDDYMNQLRDEQLIEEKEAEIDALNQLIEEYYAEYDPLDAQIESLNDYCPDLDYLEMAYDDYMNQHEIMYDDYFDDQFVEEIHMDAAYCGNQLYGYVVEDHGDFIDFDYPEGPEENLGGFRYPEPFDCMDFSLPDMEFQDDYYECHEPDIVEQNGEYLFNSEELHMNNLIRQRLEEEKEFLEFVAENEIPDEYHLPSGIDDIILC